VLTRRLTLIGSRRAQAGSGLPEKSVRDRKSGCLHPAERKHPEADWPDAELQIDGLVPIAMEGDGPLVVREKFHSATPMTIDRALFEMELVGHDFFLFRDETCHLPSVVYRRRGYHYGVIRLVEEAAPGPARTPYRRVPVD